MSEENQFQQIGKQTPYEVPAGFFERISEETLLKAKQQNSGRKNVRILWQTLAVAASMAVLIISGYLIDKVLNTTSESTLLVENKKQAEKPRSVINTTARNQPAVNTDKKDSSVKTIEKTVAKENSPEVISKVLTDMTDEELQQLAAMYKTDPFTTNESLQ